MERKTLAIILAVLLFVLGGIFFIKSRKVEDGWICQNGEWVKHGNPTAAKPSTGCEGQRPLPAEGDPIGTGQIVNIFVTAPVSGQSIGLPLTVKGQARVFESTVNLRLLEEKSRRVLVEDFVTADAPDAGEFGSFSKELFYPEPKEERGVLEVFDYSAYDGTEQDKVIIPVVFAKVSATTVKVYFGNEKKNPGAADCAQVFPVERRVPRTQAVARAALEQLLGGVKANEEKDGYFTSLNSGVRIQSLTIEDGVAQADFSAKLQEGVGGSCRVAAIRAQISETLKQFPAVKKVIISINGDSEQILQP